MISVFNSARTRLHSRAPDYIPPSYAWIPVCQPVVAAGSFGTRLYYRGAGGTIYSIDSPDSKRPHAAGTVRFLTAKSTERVQLNRLRQHADGTEFLTTISR
jgi:hypothetical protein